MTDYPDLGPAVPVPTLTPDDFGLPAPPVPPVAPVLGGTPDPKARILKLIALGIAGGLGPGRGTGLLQGMNLAEQRQQQEQTRKDAIAQTQFAQQRTDYEQQQRVFDRDLQQRQEMVARTLQALRTQVPSMKTKDEYEQYVQAYTIGLQAQGVRVTPNLLRSAAPYIAPTAKAKAQAAFDAFLKNPTNAALVKDHPEALATVAIRFDRDGDGIPESVKLQDVAALAEMPFAMDDQGKIVVYPKDTTASAKANADGIYEDLLAQATAEGKPITPILRKTLRQQALRDADEATPNRVPSSPRDRYSVQPVTNVDGTTSIVRVNLDTGVAEPVKLPEGVAGAGRPNEAAGKTAEFLPRVLEADKNANVFENRLARLGPQLDAQLPNMLRSEPGQLYRQAQDEFINAGLRDESGAAIQPSEYERYRQIYFAVPGDTAATLAQKRTARARVIQGIKIRAGNLAQGAITESAPPTADPAASAAEKLRQR